MTSFSTIRTLLWICVLHLAVACADGKLSPGAKKDMRSDVEIIEHPVVTVQAPRTAKSANVAAFKPGTDEVGPPSEPAAGNYNALTTGHYVLSCGPAHDRPNPTLQVMVGCALASVSDYKKITETIEWKKITIDLKDKTTLLANYSLVSSATYPWHVVFAVPASALATTISVTAEYKINGQLFQDTRLNPFPVFVPALLSLEGSAEFGILDIAAYKYQIAQRTFTLQYSGSYPASNVRFELDGLSVFSLSKAGTCVKDGKFLDSIRTTCTFELVFIPYRPLFADLHDLNYIGSLTIRYYDGNAERVVAIPVSGGACRQQEVVSVTVNGVTTNYPGALVVDCFNRLNTNYTLYGKK